MVARRVNPYAKVYSFGADGSAARAGSPIASVRMPKSRAHTQKHLLIRVPLWVVVLVTASIVFVQSFALLGLRSDTTHEQKHINALKNELAQVQETINSLEISIAQAGDPSRIHTLAVNRLGMRQPKPDQIYVMPRPEMPAKALETARPEEGGGILRILLSLVGL